MVYPDKMDYKDVLYHFTDVSALKNILETRELRFTYFKDLNDSSEIYYGLEQVKQHLSNTYLRNKELFLQMLQSFIEPGNKNVNVFICSFSYSYNHLPLWRFYGDNGKGVAIGFDYNFPLENEDILPKFHIPIRTNILYGYNHLKKELNKKIIDIKRIFHSSDFKKLSQSDQNEYERQIYVAFISHIIGYLPSVKHEDYSSENEVRLLLMDGKRRDIKNFPDGCQFEYFINERELHFPTIDLELQIQCRLITKQKKYVNLAKFKKDAIKKIIIGNNCDQNLIDNIKKLLVKLNYPSNIEIESYPSSFVG
ncbi:hypothetical protein LLO_0644 [Legionella longbeachae NSW150]|uniref:DUF2971 domain-containing protein n=3 Tax=Legionella TaxID=445 RepID=D3HQ16_LEGLN|nr:hypothetical protein LLO_0644 [Legionella longbeachae NSW150]